MNKLTIPNGGMPFEGDDLLYMQDQLRDTFKAFLKAFSPDNANFILQGFETTSGDGITDIAPGLVVIDYEILPFEGATLPTENIPAKALGLQITYDPAGNEVFADQVSKDTYEVRKAIIKDVENITNELRFTDSAGHFGFYVSNLSGLIKVYDIPLISGFGGSLKAYKFNHFVLIQGTVESPTESFSYAPLCILPLELLPPMTHKFLIPTLGVIDPNSIKVGYIEVGLSGIIISHPDKVATVSGLTYYI